MDDTGEYVNIMEAARRCGLSDKTIRRAIAAHKLPARRPKANVVLIAVADLEAWHDLKTDNTDRRLLDVETRVAECQAEQLELMKRTMAFHDNLMVLWETEKYNTVQQLHKMMEAMKIQDERIEALEQQVQQLTQLPGQESRQQETQPMPQLPDGLVHLFHFADLHKMSRNEAERLYRMGLIAGRRGQGKGKSKGPIIISHDGMWDFWVQFHEHPGFWACDACPHLKD